MKKLILILVLIALAFAAMAQETQGFSYQAVVRTSDGNLIRNMRISMKVWILSGGYDGESVYVEKHYTTTDANGLATVEIGRGESSDDWSAIDWSHGTFFIKTEIDPHGGENYSIVAVNQILAVPYALYAEKAGNIPDVSGFISEETDPTVSAWAKADEKPQYDYSEIANTPEIPTVPSSVSAFENDANYISTESQTLSDVAALGNSINAQIKNLVAPTDAQDAATKAYIDSLVNLLQGSLANSSFAAPTVETYTADAISGNTATLNGTVLSDGGKVVTSRGFLYGLNSNNLTTDIVASGRGLGDFSVKATGLSYATTYYFKAYAVNSIDTAFGAVLSFSTSDISLPTVETSTATNITYTSLVLNGNVTFNGNVSLSERGFIYGTSSDNLYYSATASGTSTGNYSYTLADLTPGTTYYCKAYATNSVGTSYGELESFDTPAATKPSVETRSASIVSMSVTLHGNVTSENGSEVTERGFVFGTNIESLNRTLVASGVGTGTFSYQLDDLIAGFTYYYKAYATNSVGTEYDSVLNFTLSGIVGAPGIVGEPLIDSRDGNTYATITIGSQTWMAENLRYEGDIPLGTDTSSTVAYRYYPSGNETNVPTYGYLYNWTAALNGGNSSDATPSGVQGICPNGWHLPSNSEWNILGTALSENSVGAQLASDIDLWRYDNGGRDLLDSPYFGKSGFNARPAGMVQGGRYFYDYIGYFAFFWTTTEIESGVLRRNISYASVNTGEQTSGKKNGFSVRCVRDEGADPTTFNAPLVTTEGYSVASYSATINGSVFSENGSEITERGFVYGTSPDNLNQTVIANGTGIGAFSSQITGLLFGVTYYYKAYATNGGGTAYSWAKNFTINGVEGTSGMAGGTLTDTRDNNTYATFTIGGQTWMAENLRYEGNIPLATNNQTSETVAYRYYPNGDEANITYGYLYNWTAAMNGASNSNNNPSGVQGICPNGWHLPSKAEWNQLATALGGSTNAGAQISGHSSLWTSGTLINSEYFGSSGFDALPAGAIFENGYDHFGNYAYFWTSTNRSSTNTTSAYYYYTYYNSVYLSNSEYASIKYGVSIRCVCDNATTNSVATIPSVETQPHSISTSSSAMLNGKVTFENGTEVTERGFVYGTSPDNLNQTVVATGTGTGAFSYQLTGLLAGVTYYYKAYATNGEGTAYGWMNNFTIDGVVGTLGTIGEVFVDSRDGNTYATTTIGSQIWMAENLRYEGDIPYALEGQSSESVAYRYYPNNDETNVDRYGYLYNWTAIMNGSSASAANPSGVQGICPSGWHLPSMSEWNQLITALGGSTYAGTQLSGAYILWTNGNLTESEYFGASGFMAEPAGGYSGSNYTNFGNNAYFWSTTEDNSTSVHNVYIRYDNAYLNNEDITNKKWGLSVRCICDNSASGSSTSIITVPSVETMGHISIPLSVTLKGKVSFENGSEVTERGFVYGTSPDNLDQSVVATENDMGVFSYQFTELLAGVTYYYKAYATNSEGTGYGLLNNFIVYGVAGTSGTVGEPLVDTRDGNTYATITIGEQTWMAENLRYEGSISLTEWGLSDNVAYRYYPNNNEANMPTYGYLYNWKAVMSDASSSDANPSGVRGICPNGWHLPSSAEWDQLAATLGSMTYAGAQLAGQSDLWTSGTLTRSEYFGTSGFDAVPAGYFSSSGRYGDFGTDANFWSATESSSTEAYLYFIGNNSEEFISRNNYNKKNAFSVRCVQD